MSESANPAVGAGTNLSLMKADNVDSGVPPASLRSFRCEKGGLTTPAAYKRSDPVPIPFWKLATVLKSETIRGGTLKLLSVVRVPKALTKIFSPVVWK